MRWFTSRGWEPFDYQVETWRAYMGGASGLVHAPTGMGKTYAVWMGPVIEGLAEAASGKADARGLRVLWITPLRALANDVAGSLSGPLPEMGLNWSVEVRTGDTSQTVRKRQRERLPSALVTTPESLSLILSYPDSVERLSGLRCIVVDEWHELMGTKRGVQTELGLARLRTIVPGVRTWGLSATIGNLQEAMSVLMGEGERRRGDKEEGRGEWERGGGREEGRPPRRVNSGTATPATAGKLRRGEKEKECRLEACITTDGNEEECRLETRITKEGGEDAGGAAPLQGPRFIQGPGTRPVEIVTLLPESVERFPWAGHIGIKLLPAVLERLEQAGTTLLFTNTRSQAEIWFQNILRARPEWLGQITVHHGSIDRKLRGRVEEMARAGTVRCVVCTSSLDLGVDFAPVDQVIQIGSPKGIGRLLQRAGRSGHRPGKVSRIYGVPTHAFELVEYAAARMAVEGARGGDEGHGDAGTRGRGEEDRGGEWAAVRRFVRGRGGETEGRPPRRVNSDAARRRRGDREEENKRDCRLEACITEDGDAEGGRDARPPRVEARVPLRLSLDVLVQHLVTVAMGGGFRAEELREEVRRTHAFAELTDEQWEWAMEFVTRGGPTLRAYPQYMRVAARDGSYVVPDAKLARLHRMSIGTITSDDVLRVKVVRGATLGTIEESFIARLKPGDQFVFSGRVLKLVRVRDMTAWVRRVTHPSGIVPRWQGGRMPLSSELSAAVRHKLTLFNGGDISDPEMRAIAPLLELQRAWSRIPEEDELLIEQTHTREGYHTFVHSFEGRLVHEGLSSLVAFRLTRQAPRSVSVSSNDYGFELLSPQPIIVDDLFWRQVTDTTSLLEDLLACVNNTELARRQFRDIARIAGLVFQGYPGSAKSAKQLQASSELFYDVFLEFDPANLLLDQARREVLEQQLEFLRLRGAMERIARCQRVLVECNRLTPLAFPIWADRLRSQSLTSEKWSDRIARMVVRLEKAAVGAAKRGKTRAG